MNVIQKMTPACPRPSSSRILALDFRKKSGSRSYLQHPDASRAKIIIDGIGMSGPTFLDDRSFRDFAFKKWRTNEEERKTKLAARNAAVVTAQILEQLKDYQK